MKHTDRLTIQNTSYRFFSLAKFAAEHKLNLSLMPFSLRVVAENCLRHGNDESVLALFRSIDKIEDYEINFAPARVLMQDFTGVPAIVDLAVMREAAVANGGKASQINPLVPVDLVIDHSVQVDHYGNKDAFGKNVQLEMARNIERYQFLKWGQNVFSNFTVVPPGTGICHQVNLEYLSKVVCEDDDLLYPDSLVGTDSHTTMAGGLAVLGWGVGGIEAEAVMLGQGISMLIPEVVGVKFNGTLREGITATDLVLTITKMLREVGVVGKFVEFTGSGLACLSLADRATIANMAPEYGATASFFPIDERTIAYLRLSGRSDEHIELVEKYAKAAGFWADGDNLKFTSLLEIDLATISPSVAGPKRPQDLVPLENLANIVRENIPANTASGVMNHGDIVIAAITSCTNTSNPSVMIAAGLLAQKAVALGLVVPTHVKTSLAPGSKVVTAYLKALGLDQDLAKLGFNLVGYGCTTCIGNSGPLDEFVEQEIKSQDLSVAAILSGNRNFEGRVHPLVKLNFLASPPLVVAFAIAGTSKINLTTEPIAKNIYLKDIWPTTLEIEQAIAQAMTSELFIKEYKDIFTGDALWQEIAADSGDIYDWKEDSTYIRKAPYFTESKDFASINNARILGIFGDSITTDHISPAGDIAENSPAALYLESKGVGKSDFNSYGARRGNHEVMMRGTFANPRIKNLVLNGKSGGYTIYNGTAMSIYDAAMKYKAENIPLVIFAGKEYGTGSSRDWAAKGTMLLGVKAVIAESFERIHRSNLAGMGLLPFTYIPIFEIKGNDIVNILMPPLSELSPKMIISCQVTGDDGVMRTMPLILRLDTEREIEYYKAGGIMNFVVNRFANL